MSAPAITTSDMRQFEGALEEKWCHIVVDGSAVSLCGHTSNEAVHDDAGDLDGRCVTCGRRNCPECERAWKELYE